MALNLSSKTPVEIDGILFPLLAQRWTHVQLTHRIRHTLAKTIWPAEYKERYEKYIGRYDSKVYPIDLRYGGENEVIRQVGWLNGEQAKVEALQAEIEPLEAEYDRRPWNRFILVGGGHIHVPHKCGSIRPTTQTLWLIEAAGMVAEEVVRKYSYTACTKCFPDAPVATVEVDPKVCTGNPFNYDHTQRVKYSTCLSCGARGISKTSTGKLRKHNKPEEVEG